MDAQLGGFGLVYNVIRNYRDFMSKRLLINTLLLHYGCKLIADVADLTFSVLIF